jgi:hypothetical protein
VNHASLFLDVVRSERQLAMDRWQLVRDATSTGPAAEGKGRIARSRASLGPSRWFTRTVPMAVPEHHAIRSATCC